MTAQAVHGNKIMIRPWQEISTQLLGDYRIFTVRTNRRVSPRTHREHDFYVIDTRNWVNVIALTPAQEIILVEQYRHGTGTIELEIPGGVMDAEDTSPVKAGQRELREETGYQGDNARLIGQISPNPAIMSNTCYTVLVENCVVRSDTHFDHGEDLITHLIPVAQLPELVASGKIRHALVVVALYHFDLLQRKLTPPRP
jgi:ADP-ribose pyrophosphatase